jgi:hypothetical protein
MKKWKWLWSETPCASWTHLRRKERLSKYFFKPFISINYFLMLLWVLGRWGNFLEPVNKTYILNNQINHIFILRVAAKQQWLKNQDNLTIGVGWWISNWLLPKPRKSLLSSHSALVIGSPLITVCLFEILRHKKSEIKCLLFLFFMLLQCQLLISKFAEPM